jgi:hypothetical protein
MNSLTIGLAVLAISTATLAGNSTFTEVIRQNPNTDNANPNAGSHNPSSGAINPRTGEFYASAAGGGVDEYPRRPAVSPGGARWLHRYPHGGVCAGPLE